MCNILFLREKRKTFGHPQKPKSQNARSFCVRQTERVPNLPIKAKEKNKRGSLRCGVAHETEGNMKMRFGLWIERSI